MEQLAKKCGLMITQGKKGKPKLLYAGFAYFRNNSKGPKTYWLCAKNRDNRCRARIITCSMTGELMIKNQNHNHPAPPPSVIPRGQKKKNVVNIAKRENEEN
ncbi:unnamed protein product [Ceratitis capitata]|uniref:(Mediterranean fruit fly) hypothetical protein n=2 Tax=Ceratitis capitata TaxID=7213 RepID=A0A811U9M4_CERCA|nr:unnamed protein product [Ceratitis capitata]